VRVGRDKNNHVLVWELGKTRDSVCDLVGPLLDSLVMSNIEWDVNNVKWVVVRIIFGKKLFHYCKVAEILDGVVMQMKKDSGG